MERYVVLEFKKGEFKNHPWEIKYHWDFPSLEKATNFYKNKLLEYRDNIDDKKIKDMINNQLSKIHIIEFELATFGVAETNRHSLVDTEAQTNYEGFDYINRELLSIKREERLKSLLDDKKSS